MFAVRALTAAVLLAALLAALLWLGRAAFATLVALILALGAREWARLLGLTQRHSLGYALACTLGYALLAWWLLPEASSAPPRLGLWLLAVLFWGAVVPLWLARGVTQGSRSRLLPAGLMVLVPAALAMAALSPGPLLALLGLVWIADTAAYLAGRAFGRCKLAPSISPRKTWEGVAGAVLASLAYAIILAAWWPELGRHVTGVVWLAYLAGAVILCATSIVGDLFESALKRQAGVKDSGALLPGHGGVLDRIDSATAVLPVGALLMVCLGVA
ncbi:MAG: phosphatidate cytidylyltransferase [Betaproteobacteria bacterium]|nr:MAG: phosphatidate cytidylyltransferase [Betaproteobacteria bacterium]